MVEPRPAATVILLRDGSAGPEVWLMERNRAVGFMASAWVFPGGRVDAADAGEGPPHDPPRSFWTAAARELREEAGVDVPIAAMRPWAHWITPEVEPRRYDTWFFAARLPEGAEPVADGSEAVAGRWIRPEDGIRQAYAGELPVAPPTLRCLMELLAYESVAAVLAAERVTPPICPRFATGADGELYVLLPGDPEHPSPDRVEPPHRYVFGAGRWWNR
ncbi:MAG: NUDIX hydrolase [Myxococcota bacterium]